MLVLLLAGLYLWGASLKQAVIVSPITPDRPTRAENNEPESTNAEADVDTAAALSTSNELDLIQADLENTNLNTLDAELTTIDIEMENP